jgi:protein O-mannosyl-transferase
MLTPSDSAVLASSTMAHASDRTSTIARRRPALIPTMLVLGTLVTFAPALWNGFVAWDDDPNFIKNADYRGLGLRNLRWMFTNVLMGHWIPVTWLTLGLDYTLWGMNPFGYHLTSNVLHAVNVALVYAVCLRLLATPGWTDLHRRAGAATAALFFGLHPLRAESVAWVTERRDVLSMAFFLLAILLYLRAQQPAPSRRRLLAFSLVAFVLGIASKAMIMTLPAVLLILDVYPLRRIRFDAAGWSRTRGVLIEKAPFAMLGVAGAAVGYYGQHANRLFNSFENVPWTARTALVGYSYAFYLWKTVMPVGLSPLYELPAGPTVFQAQFAGAWLAVSAITALVIVLRRRCPALMAAWAYYLITLLPVSGIAHAGPQIASDRYSYLPCLGFAVLVGAGVSATLSSAARPALVRLGTGAIGALLVSLAILTSQQVGIWRDTLSLWMYAVEVEPTCSTCHSNLGVWLGDRGNLAAAIQHMELALALRPDVVRTHLSLGIQLVNAKRFDEAIAHFEQLLAANPSHVETLVALGVARLQQNRLADAQAVLVRALKVRPDHILARSTYASALGAAGLRDEALAEHRRALALDARWPPARFAYGATLATFGDLDGARAELDELGRLDPRLAARLAAQIARKL